MIAEYGSLGVGSAGNYFYRAQYISTNGALNGVTLTAISTFYYHNLAIDEAYVILFLNNLYK
jgi:hypothetical protein